MDVRRRLLGSTCVFLLVILAASLTSSSVARAAEPVERVTALNKKALDEVKKRDYDTARALLKEALEVCNNGGLDTHPIKARTHIHLGMVAIAGFKERDLAIKHFRKALEIQPDIKLTKTFASRDMQDAFEEAMTAASGGGGEASAPPAGEEGGAVPQASDGRPAAAETDEEGGGERPRARAKKPPKKKKKADDEDGEEGGSGEGSGGDDGEEDEEGGAFKYRFFLSLSFGSGFGVASGKGDVDPNMHSLQAAGFAPAQLGHISPEVGWFFTPVLMVSARARLQYVSGLTGKAGTGCGADNFCTPGTSAVAAFVRATYFLSEGAFRLFVAGEIGGGYIKHAQVFPNDRTCGMGSALTQCVDSVSGGPFLIGPAFGFLYDFSDTVGVTLNVAADLGVSKFTVNFDVNAGLALHF